MLRAWPAVIYNPLNIQYKESNETSFHWILTLTFRDQNVDSPNLKRRDVYLISDSKHRCLVSNLNYEYQNADLALLSPKLKKSITCLMSLHEMVSLVHYSISTGNSLFMLRLRAYVVICKYIN